MSTATLILRVQAWRRSALSELAIIPPLVFSTQIVVMGLLAFFAPNLGDLATALMDATLLTLLATPSLVWFVVRPLLDALAKERREMAAREQELLGKARLKEFEAQLSRGLEMADNEAEALRVAAHALGQVLKDAPAEVLLSDSGSAELRREVQHGAGDVPPVCPVQSAEHCPAARRGQTIVFPDSAAIDACPHLRGRPGGACSGVCLPVSMMGRNVGVIHTSGAPDQPPGPEIVGHLQVLADQMGHRIGVIRAVESIQQKASTDPLTGLLNRRSFEERATAQLASGRPSVLAIADLDHFKHLNDTYGHEVGDRALRLFARTVRSTMRGADLVGRLGGEEFCLLLTDCSVETATQALERLRAALARALQRDTTPAFTVSIGVVDSDQADTLDGLCSLADRALYAAKHAGRDRIALASDLPEELPELPQRPRLTHALTM